MQRFIKIFSVIILLLSGVPFTASADATQVPIRLTVVTHDATLFDADITVSECLDTETGTSTSVNAFCAIEAVASSSGWTLATTWYPFGHSLDGIDAYTADFANNRYWIYYVNGAPGMTSLNAEQLTPGEHLTLAYGINPLRIVVASSSPEVGTSTLLTGQYFDPMLFDWTLATGTIFTVNDEATSSDASGTLMFIPSTTTPYIITLVRDGYIPSPAVTLTPYLSEAATTSATSSQSEPTPPSVQGGSATPEATHTIDIEKAVAYLRTAQSVDGSFGATLYTDWVAIGLPGVSGADDIRVKLVAYLMTNTDPGALPTDIERRAMALLALGVDPSSGTSRDYIRELLTHFDGSQWGSASEVNDDIFALIPLTHVGYGASDVLIQKTVAHIVAAQSTSGSWGSVDLTAAGMMALSPYAALPGASDAITKAKAYLHGAQGEGGGFGSSFATSWVLQSLAGEDIAMNWTKNGKNPQDYLWLLQAADGGIESTSLDQSARVWATAYAIPASAGKDWHTLLAAFPRSHTIPLSSFGSAVGGDSGEVLGTTTLMTATTSAPLATSTSAVVTPQSATTTLTIATSTPDKATSTPVVKKPVIVKKVTPKKTGTTSPLRLASSTVATTSVIAVPPARSSWTSVVTKPFIRLYQEVSSWFH
jgi:hypothetical protein